MQRICILRFLPFRLEQCRFFHIIGFGIKDNMTSSKEISFVSAFDASEKVIKSSEIKLKEMRELAKVGGGSRAELRHINVNKKLLPRHRLKLLFDEGRFDELLQGAGYAQSYGHIPSAGIIGAIGRVNKRLCFALCNDSTFKSGSIYPIGVKKQLRLQTLVRQLKLPALYLVDSAGGFLPLQAEFFADALGGGRIFAEEALLNADGRVPQIAYVGGSCTAGGAYLPTMTEELIMSRGIGHIFLGGPPLVQAATGEVVSADELGGAELHCSLSGVSDHFGESEIDALEQMRASVDTLPLQRRTDICQAHFQASSAKPLFPPSRLRECAPNAAPSASTRGSLLCLLSCLLDGSLFHEFMARYGRMVAGFGRIGGHMAGLMASAGPLNECDALKAGRLIQLCQQRQLPLISLVHTVAQGEPVSNTSAIDHANCLRAKAKLMSLQATANIPKITIVVGDAFGDDYLLMGAACMEPLLTLAWCNSRFSSFAPTVGCGVEPTWDACEAAGNLWIDDVIMPEETRQRLEDFMEMISIETPGFSHLKNNPILRM